MRIFRSRSSSTVGRWFSCETRKRESFQSTSEYSLGVEFFVSVREQNEANWKLCDRLWLCHQWCKRRETETSDGVIKFQRSSRFIVAEDTNLSVQPLFDFSPLLLLRLVISLCRHINTRVIRVSQERFEYKERLSLNNLVDPENLNSFFFLRFFAFVGMIVVNAVWLKCVCLCMCVWIKEVSALVYQWPAHPEHVLLWQVRLLGVSWSEAGSSCEELTGAETQRSPSLKVCVWDFIPPSHGCFVIAGVSSWGRLCASLTLWGAPSGSLLLNVAAPFQASGAQVHSWSGRQSTGA